MSTTRKSGSSGIQTPRSPLKNAQLRFGFFQPTSRSVFGNPDKTLFLEHELFFELSHFRKQISTVLRGIKVILIKMEYSFIKETQRYYLLLKYLLYQDTKRPSWNASNKHRDKQHGQRLLIRWLLKSSILFSFFFFRTVPFVSGAWLFAKVNIIFLF